jgi:hypothetical protein
MVSPFCALMVNMPLSSLMALVFVVTFLIMAPLSLSLVFVTMPFMVWALA